MNEFRPLSLQPAELYYILMVLWYYIYAEWKTVAHILYIWLLSLSQGWSTVKKKTAINVMSLNILTYKILDDEFL